MIQKIEPAVTVAVLSDDPDCLEAIRTALPEEGLELLTANDPKDGVELVRHLYPQIVLVDLGMSKVKENSKRTEWLEQIVQTNPGAEVVVMTSDSSTDSVVETIRKGACDFLGKPLSAERVRERLDKLLNQARERRRTLKLDLELVHAFQFHGMVGRSPLMLEVYARIRRVAPHFQTVLVTGPTGTGKELVAAALHRLSPAAKGPFVACNCSAIAETLIESELFGHVKGAFTGATEDKAGLFEHANGGTLLLDEISDMPRPAQAKLLRVLQNRELQRVGSPKTRKVDVKIIAATNQNLPALVAEKKFREDLFYRLSMVDIELAPLSDRKEDLPLLMRHFVERFAEEYRKPIRGIARRAQALLSRYDWPGNVRELENVLGNACMMVETGTVDVGDLPERIRNQRSRSLPHAQEMLSLAEVQRRHARQVVERLGGNKARAAEVLGISRATLYRLLGRKLADAPGSKRGEH